MKIYTAVLAAVFASTARGFSVTMSSYLDRLDTGAVKLSSFAPTGSAPSPSYSYSPAPAPAPMAQAPASSDLNYMKSLGGNTALKSGRNYSGVSSSFRPTRSGNSYLDSMSTAAVSASVPASFSPAPAPVTYQSSFAEVPASTDLNYMKTIGGGSALKSGRNYSGVSSSFRPTRSGNSYLDSMSVTTATTSAPASFSPAPVSAPASVESSSASAPSSTDLNYMKTLGGGSAMKSGRNYSGVSSTFRPTRSGNSYLDSMSVSSASVSVPASFSSAPASAPAPASTDLNYMKTLGGGSAMKSGRNYSGVSSSFRPTRSGNSYLDSMTTSSASASVPASFSSAPASAPAPASTDLNYMKTLGGGSAMKSGRNFSGVSSSFRPTRSGNSYLDSMSVSSASASVPASFSAAPVSAPAVAESSSAAAPVSADTNYLKALGGNTVLKKGRNYSGVSSTFRPTRSGNSYLDSMSASSVSASVPASFAAPSNSAPAPAPATYQSSLANTPASNDLNYLKTLGGGSSMKNGRNFAGVSSYFRPTSSGSPYLDALKGKSMTPSYSSEASSAPAPSPTPSYSAAPPANGTYLQNLNGASVSSSYTSMHNSFAKATSSYSGVNPKPRATRSAFGSYLDAI